MSVPKYRANLQAGLLAGAWGIFAAVALWRTELTVANLGNTSIADMVKAVVYWRRLDEFLPWMVVALLLLSGARTVTAPTLQQARIGKVLAALVALGALLTGVGIAADQWGWFDGWFAGIAGLSVMALCALLASMREIRSIAAAMRSAAADTTQPRGVTILDLWRFAAAQWGLLMLAATLFIWITVPRQNWLGNQTIQHLLFAVPAAGALPSVMMAAGIAWWDAIVAASAESPARVDLRSAARPRVRAWMLAFLFNTAAGLLLVLRPPLATALGAILQTLAIVLYLVGFPTIFWRSAGGKIVLAAWLLLELALGAMTLERVLSAQGDVSFYYNIAWRQIWIAAALLFATGMGTRGLECLMPSAWMRPTRRAILLATGLILLGTAATTAVLLLNATQTSATQVSVMRWLIAGTLPTAAGALGLGAALLRTLRSR